MITMYKEVCPVRERLNDILKEIIDSNETEKMRCAQQLDFIKVCCGECQEEGIRASVTRFLARHFFKTCSIENALPFECLNDGKLIIRIGRDFETTM